MPLTGQLERLQALLAQIVPANPFYGSKLPGRVDSLEEFFQTVPFTRKQDLMEDQRRFPPFGSNLTYPLSRYTRFSQTSGTSGMPMRWLDTPESWAWMLDNWEVVFRTAGVEAGDSIFFAFSFGPFLGFWTAFESAVRMGCLAIPGGGMRSTARLRAILDMRAAVLCCTPTYAIHLAEAAAAEGIDLSHSPVRRIIVGGEPGGSIPGTRATMERLWPGARVVDHHGMTEIGPVSYGCPARPGLLHVIERAFIAEIIDPETGVHVPRGDRGELVLTNLGRLGRPLVRYRTGDVVRQSMDDRCACGSSDMALEGGIVGRTDDMVVVRGVNIYPTAVEQIVRGFGEIAEYQAHIGQKGAMTEMHLVIEPRDSVRNAAALVAAVEKALQTAFNLRIPVATAPSGSLPRAELKARR
ncbi:MAG: AMP-binding protein, partial [Bryobacteraceae bacterium]|nr:AMP-binding protein [Bryobacteraceae bacterium]